MIRLFYLINIEENDNYINHNYAFEMFLVLTKGGGVKAHANIKYASTEYIMAITRYFDYHLYLR